MIYNVPSACLWQRQQKLGKMDNFYIKSIKKKSKQDSNENGIALNDRQCCLMAAQRGNARQPWALVAVRLRDVVRVDVLVGVAVLVEVGEGEAELVALPVLDGVADGVAVTLLLWAGPPSPSCTHCPNHFTALHMANVSI